MFEFSNKKILPKIRLFLDIKLDLSGDILNQKLQINYLFSDKFTAADASRLVQSSFYQNFLKQTAVYDYSQQAAISSIEDTANQIEKNLPLTITNREMTRFLMSLSDSVDLVNYAFENASSGDLLVRKAPAATVEVLVEALKQLFDVADAQIQLIGVRHGEKIYESLLSTEEMAHAIDQETYFRVPLDTRGLDYSIYFEEGESRTEELSSYTSHNTVRLDVDGVKKLLLTLPEVQQELNLS